MAEFSIFYAWQSGHPTATNWTFIKDALHKACKAVALDPNLNLHATIDRDTKGVPGAPAIPATILAKIDNGQAFIADVSLCYNEPNTDRAPNPNVLFELGYAIARLGWDRIVLVVNEEYGPIRRPPV